MTDTITISVEGTTAIRPGVSDPTVYTGLSYSKATDPLNRGVLSTPTGGSANSRLNVRRSGSGAQPQPAIVKYNVNATALPDLRFAAIEWIGSGSLDSDVSGGTITITDSDLSGRTYKFYIWFRDTKGVLKGRSQDPTIYNNPGTTTA